MQNDSTSPDIALLNYLDFELEIGPGSGRDYPVSVISSPAGEAHETMRFPFDRLALESCLKDLRIALLRSAGVRRQTLSPEEQTVRGFGRDLFNALLTGEVRSRFDVSLQEARKQGKGLRLKLRVQPPELAALPWEFLYDTRRGEYVCLSRDNPIVRYLELTQPIQPLIVTPPLHILGMIASPRDLPPLDVAREKQRIETAIRELQAKGLVDLTWLEGQTWRDLQRAMRGGPWHIFHFHGHGGFDRNADEGFIALADEDRLTHRFRATELGRLLADQRSLRLVILNSCEGARASEQDIFSSTAAVLVRRGMPAVLAMQYEITDDAAIELARSFYEALADGLPVDAAVTEARKAVSLATANTIEWGIPVLYMHASQGVIFQLPDIRHAPPPIPPRPDNLDKETEQRLERLYTDGLSAFWVEDWDTACRSFQAILDECPDYPNTAAKLQEARRLKMLNTRYEQALAAQAAEDWQAAQEALEAIVAEAAEFKDAAALLAAVKRQKQLADLYAQARSLSEAKQWQAVVNVFVQIKALDTGFADPEELLPAAERELAAQKRQIEIEHLYRQAVRNLDAGAWQEARRLLVSIQAMQPNFRDSERLLAKVDSQLARQEAEQQRNEQIATLYEQAIGLARTRQWRPAQAKVQEIQRLDAQFADPEGIAARAQEAIAAEEAETQRQNELAVLYAEAVNLVQAQQYQAALEKWAEVQARDPSYPDRQKVQSTVKRKLNDLAKASAPKRGLSRRGLVALGVLGLAIVIGAAALLIRQPKSGGTQTAATAAPAAVASAPTRAPAPTRTPIPIPHPTPTIDADPAVYDNFNNPAYDGSYDKSRWVVRSSDAKSEIAQQNGRIRMTVHGHNHMDFIPQEYGYVRLARSTFFETEILLDPATTGEGTDIGLTIALEDKAYARCSIFGGAEKQQEVRCWSEFFGVVPKTAGVKAIVQGTWHKVRIEMYPETMTVIYYIDDQKLGSHVLDRAEELRSAMASLFVQNNNWGSSAAAPTGYIDNVRIGLVGS